MCECVSFHLWCMVQIQLVIRQYRLIDKYEKNMNYAHARLANDNNGDNEWKKKLTNRTNAHNKKPNWNVTIFLFKFRCNYACYLLMWCFIPVWHYVNGIQLFEIYRITRSHTRIHIFAWKICYFFVFIPLVD